MSSRSSLLQVENADTEAAGPLPEGLSQQTFSTPAFKIAPTANPEGLSLAWSFSPVSPPTVLLAGPWVGSCEQSTMQMQLLPVSRPSTPMSPMRREPIARIMGRCTVSARAKIKIRRDPGSRQLQEEPVRRSLVLRYVSRTLFSSSRLWRCRWKTNLHFTPNATALL